MKNYRRLSRNERDDLAVLMNRGHSLRKIAFFLGRSHSSLVREIQRNKGLLKYRPADAHITARLRQKQSHKRPTYLHSHPHLVKRITHDLKKGWSPELIAGRLRKEHGRPVVSHEAIYRWVYNDARHLIKHLVHSHPHRRHRWQKPWPRRVIPHRVSIHKRPPDVLLRQVPGHWETDLLCGSGLSALKVLVERKTRFVQLALVPDKTPQASYDALALILNSIPLALRLSITYDNGFENISHYHLNHRFQLRSYFCEPYHSWEKGTVENTNGLIRRFLKKGTNLATISPNKIRDIQNWLNNRPRKCLNFQTPAEAYSFETGALTP